MSDVLQEFDWVTARADCSIGIMFEKQREQAKADTEVRERLRGERDRHYAFKFISEGPSMFAALVDGHQIHDVVSFRLENDSIVE